MTTATLAPYIQAGTAAQDGYSLVVTPERAGWVYIGLRILELAPGESTGFDTGLDEVLVLPLRGSGDVRCDGEVFHLTGRDSVFAGISDFAYAPRECRVELTTATGGRFALPSARADQRLAPRYGAAADVAVELRGAGAASRQVNNFCTPEAFPAEKLMAVEVLTPGGNWSSYPPHKHDEERPDESVLEEIYYFEVAGDGVGYQRVYSSGAGREIDVCAEVRTGDAVLIPYGYHGPSMAAPGYDLYYLNVMAGPGERAWRFRDDPARAWIRDSWQGQAVDARLPLTRVESAGVKPGGRV